MPRTCIWPACSDKGPGNRDGRCGEVYCPLLYGDETRTLEESMAQPGECLLKRSRTWEPSADTDNMTVPEMLVHIYKNRRSYAVAPNGNTCPFLTVEEWSKIADWAVDQFVKETQS
jgi:hypothetical protein